MPPTHSIGRAGLLPRCRRRLRPRSGLRKTSPTSDAPICGEMATYHCATIQSIRRMQSAVHFAKISRTQPRSSWQKCSGNLAEMSRKCNYSRHFDEYRSNVVKWSLHCLRGSRHSAASWRGATRGRTSGNARVRDPASPPFTIEPWLERTEKCSGRRRHAQLQHDSH